MDINHQIIEQAVGSSFSSSLQKAKSNSKPFEQPLPRILHSLFSHRAFIYIYGGLSLNPQRPFQNQHLFVYRYEIHRFEWKKIQTNFPNNPGYSNALQNIFGHSCVVYGNVMYLFGGKSGINGQCLNELWTMNLQSFNWRKQDQKGIIPPRRQSGSLVLTNKSYLFLYGGKDQNQVLNDFHVYKIQSKQWYSIENSIAEFIMPKRLRPGICVVNDVIFVFGGERQSSLSDNREILDDFYQIKIIQKTTSIKPDIWVKKLTTSIIPTRIDCPKLFNVNDKYIGLVTGNQSQFQAHNRLWLIDPLRLEWIFSQIQDLNGFGLGFGFNALFHFDRVYLSGGLRNDMKPFGILYSIHIDPNDIPQSIVAQYQSQRLCMICGEQKQSLLQKKLNGFSLVEEVLKQMKYPLNAFGLLIDNSNLLKSNSINVKCCQLNKQKYLLIQDDGNCENIWQNEEQFLQDMIKFRTISQQQMIIDDEETKENSTDNINEANIENQEEDLLNKKIQQQNKQDPLLIFAKKQQEKEQQRKLKKKKQQAKKNKARKIMKRKQFSINIKMGTMRLAKKIIYVTQTSDGTKRVFFIEQIKILDADEENPSEDEIKYQCHYFTIPSPTTTTNPNSHYSSQISRQFIQSEYRNYLTIIEQNNLYNNHLFLIGLKQILTSDGTKEPELKINTKTNDIYFGSSKLITKVQSLNISLSECIDISLKYYLSMLYLKGQSAKITISMTPQKSQQISNALNFDKIDNLVKSNVIMDLDAAFDLEQCKIVELYSCKNIADITKKTSKNQKKDKFGLSSAKQYQSNSLGIFVNGILIYHKNRLIKRYNYPLGTLFKQSELKKNGSKNYNPLKTFGFIEMHEIFYSNILKTDFVNDEDLHDVYARIKFVQQYIQTQDQIINNQSSMKKGFRKESLSAQQQPQGKKKLKTE